MARGRHAGADRVGLHRRAPQANRLVEDWGRLSNCAWNQQQVRAGEIIARLESNDFVANVRGTIADSAAHGFAEFGRRVHHRAEADSGSAPAVGCVLTAHRLQTGAARSTRPNRAAFAGRCALAQTRAERSDTASVAQPRPISPTRSPLATGDPLSVAGTVGERWRRSAKRAPFPPC